MSEALQKTVIPEAPIAVAVTEDAANKIWELIQEEGNLKLKLRVFINGGGCSGFQYGFSFVEKINADDTVITKVLATQPLMESIENNEQATGERIVQLLIDPLSLIYLMGAEIDYKSDLRGEQFIIRNPLAKATCGCGSSFAV
jgi:iron-sulfur cluster insertion protein